MKIKLPFLQPAPPSARFIGVQREKGGAASMETMLRQLIRAAIESIPISRKKKAELLQKILAHKKGRR